MFKKIFKSVMVVAMLFSSAFVAVGCACTDPDDEFPSAYNAEFEEYSEKVVSIMDKIGKSEHKEKTLWKTIGMKYLFVW